MQATCMITATHVARDATHVVCSTRCPTSTVSNLLISEPNCLNGEWIMKPPNLDAVADAVAVGIVVAVPVAVSVAVVVAIALAHALVPPVAFALVVVIYC